MSRLKRELDIYGMDLFVAHEDIAPTKEWQREIETALDSCDALLAYLTPTFHDSLWVDQEIGYCINRRVLIIPLRAGLDPYGFLGKYQGLNCGTKTPEAVSREIFDLLIGHSLTASNLASGLIGRLEEADSFDIANRIARLLTSVDSWTPDLLRRLENAYKSNNQVTEAYTAQSVVPRILRESNT